MIQAYLAKNPDFNMNGDSVLIPTSCKLSVKLNGAWQLELSHPLDREERWRYLEEGGVIAAPTFQSGKQLFRINKICKMNTGITAIAYPIFFDSADDCLLMDVRPTMKTGQEALDIMTAGSRYSGESDIVSGSTAYFVRRNLMSAINGEEDPSFISRWGGEMLYDNYKVIINERVGGDYGVEVRYGKNLMGMEYQVDLSEVITRIVPVSYNGYTLEGDSPWVDSPNIGKYAKVYTKEVKFDDVKLLEDASGDEEAFSTLEELREELVRRCNVMYSNGADLPRVTVTVDMADLSKCEEYREYEDLEKVGLGDTVRCYNTKLDIMTEARVVELEWDCVRDIPGTVVLGEFKYDYFTELSTALTAVKKIMGPHNTVVAERVQGVLNAINTQLRYQKNVAQRQDVRAILFEDLDRSSPNYGAMSIGTQGFQIADRRTADGRDWDWTTAFTAKGGYVDTLIGGILVDKTGRSFWNLDTGEMQLSGVFRQFATNGYKSVEILNNMIRFYAWESNGDYVGSVGAVRRKIDGRRGVEMWCDKGDVLWLGVRTGEEDDYGVTQVFEYDSNNMDATPWLRNTVSGNFLAGGVSIEVENGLIKDIPPHTLLEGTMTFMSGLGWSNGAIDWIQWSDVTVKKGCIADCKDRRQNF
ncbi:phage minor structural protein [Dorea sp. 5-2]|nr:phage minor structural protein [Dorea sp. 5-2]